MIRYQRNILIKQLGEEGQKKLADAKVLVCGAGGLGSGVLLNLASLGVGTIGIIDDDKVELSNLNRQYIHKISTLGQEKVESAAKTIKEYNPDICLLTYKKRLNETNAYEMFSNYDVIVDCFDNYYSKFVLSDTVIKTNKTLVHGGVEEFFGQVCTINRDSACLSCFIPELYGCANDIIPGRGIVSPVVSTIASIQAMEVFKVIAGLGEPLYNTMLTYNALSEDFRKIRTEKNKNCPSCSHAKN